MGYDSQPERPVDMVAFVGRWRSQRIRHDAYQEIQ
jgi:hypothetical protein